jgi:hypothetical protein
VEGLGKGERLEGVQGSENKGYLEKLIQTYNKHL